MLLLGIDVGTSSIKVAVVNAANGECITAAQYPEQEMEILAPQPGWAEQDPELWWQYVQSAILMCNATGLYNPRQIAAIGIAYQMHGLVCVDKQQDVLRNAIIWCDGRAVNLGEQAFHDMGEDYCLGHLLNSPGNFTASKLKWVQQHEPLVYEQVDKVLLPGDFIAMKFTGEITTTVSALSEGIFWDFKEHELAAALCDYYSIHPSMIPGPSALFGEHGRLTAAVATSLGLATGIPVSYKAGDQPNNAFSLNVLNPGEVAATAGTSGVIYGVGDGLNYDRASRINSFAHVNHDETDPRIGVLLCINGTGISNRWVKNLAAANYSYQELNELAAATPVGSRGLQLFPFGNGPERMFCNMPFGAHYSALDFNTHTIGHIVRATQEGIAYSFRYGLDIMRENQMNPSVIRAGKTNLFLSDVFTRAFVNVTGVPVELYQTDGSIGAAIGAGVGAGIYSSAEQGLTTRKALTTIYPDETLRSQYESLYQQWSSKLIAELNRITEQQLIGIL